MLAGVLLLAYFCSLRSNILHIAMFVEDGIHHRVKKTPRLLELHLDPLIRDQAGPPPDRR